MIELLPRRIPILVTIQKLSFFGKYCIDPEADAGDWYQQSQSQSVSDFANFLPH